jgi:hypothetical protein
MPFGPDPVAGAFVLERHDLVLTRAAAEDAQETYDLLWHPEMTFLDDEDKPPSVAAQADSFKALRESSHVAGGRRFQWTARRRDSGALVALAVGELDSSTSLTVVREDDGTAGDVVPVETRIIEVTVYVHPDHQEAKGSHWGSKSAGLVFQFGRDHFGCTVRRAKIRLTNEKSRRRAEAGGLTLVRSGDPPGYGIWEGPIPESTVSL